MNQTKLLIKMLSIIICFLAISLVNCKNSGKLNPINYKQIIQDGGNDIINDVNDIISDDSIDVNLSDQILDSLGNCVDNGGFCVPMDPDGCPDGSEALDATQNSCGAPLGLMCCILIECGGIANLRCPENKWCKLNGNYPDSSGHCIDIGTCEITDDCTDQENDGVLPSLESCTMGIPANHVCIKETCKPSCGSPNNACVMAEGQCTPYDTDGCTYGELLDPTEYSCNNDALMCCRN